MKIKKYLAFTYLAALLMPGLVYANDNDEIYRKLLKAEYNNRVFAYLSTQIIAKNRVGSPMGEFYQAYFQLEKLNRGRYERMKSELNLDYQPNLFTRTRGKLTGYVSSVIPITAGMLVAIIQPYMEKLAALKEAAPIEHAEFFAYVVAQEKAQLKTAQTAENKGWSAGATILREFIEHQQ